MYKHYKPKQQQYRINERIPGQEFRLLDDTGKQIGIVTRTQAIEMAREQELDLVEIAPLAKPPVIKLIDYSKFLYQEKKKKQEQKRSAKTSETKQVQMGPFIDNHDLDVKLKHAREFLAEGNKVRIVIKFRGREITKKELGGEVLKRSIESLSDVSRVEREIHMEGRQMVVVLTKGKSEKASNHEEKVES